MSQIDTRDYGLEKSTSLLPLLRLMYMFLRVILVHYSNVQRLFEQCHLDAGAEWQFNLQSIQNDQITDVKGHK